MKEVAAGKERCGDAQRSQEAERARGLHLERPFESEKPGAGGQLHP